MEAFVVASERESTPIASGKSVPISVDGFLFFIIIGFSVWTVFSQIHTLMGWSFRSLVHAYSVWLVLQGGVGLYSLVVHNHELKTVSGKPENLLLAAFCLLGILLAIGWIRPDPDDFNYLGGRVVYWVENPKKPLDLVYHNYALLPFPVRNYLLFYQSYDLLPGFLNYLFNIEILDAYHVWLPALTGTLIPLIWFTVLRNFVSSKTAALMGVLGVILYLCLDGTTHRSLGNFAFVRIWQSKAIYISCCLPLFMGWTFRFLDHPDRIHFGRLFMLGIATTGLSASTFPLTLFLTIMMGTGYLFSRGVSKKTIKTILWYISAQGGLFIYGVCTELFVNKQGIKLLGFEAGFPKDILGQYRLVFGSGKSLTLAVAIVSLLLLLLLADREKRRFFLGWLAVGAVLLYNPFTMPFIAEHFTSESIYWRLFYIIPFPLALGLACALLAERMGVTFRTLLVGAVICPMIAGLYSWRFPEQSVYGRLPFQPFHHKIWPDIEQDVRYIIRNTPPGPIIAPYRYRVYISVLDNQRKMIFGRIWFVPIEAAIHNMPDLAASRMKAVNISESRGRGGLPAFEKALADGVVSVVLDATKINDKRITDLLLKHGFILRNKRPAFSIFVKANH